MQLKRKLLVVLFLLLSFIGQGIASVYAMASMSAHGVPASNQSVNGKADSTKLDSDLVEMSEHCKTNEMSLVSGYSSESSLNDSSNDHSKQECCSDCSCPVGGCASQVMLDLTIHSSYQSSSIISYELLTSYSSKPVSGLYRPPIFS